MSSNLKQNYQNQPQKQFSKLHLVNCSKNAGTFYFCHLLTQIYSVLESYDVGSDSMLSNLFAAIQNLQEVDQAK